MKYKRFNSKEMEQYWLELSNRYIDRKKDPYAFSIVCHPGMPLFVNRYFGYFQRRSIKKALEYLKLNLNGKKVLDIGCGGGRICKLFQTQRAKVTGIDIQSKTIAQNKKIFPNIEFFTMPVTELNFPVGSFDFVSSVTMLQHLPYIDQLTAASQILKVLKNKGHLLLLEWTTESTSPHMFPREKDDWVKLFKDLKLQLVYSRGVGFDLLFRTLNVSLSKVKFLLPIQKGSGKFVINKDDKSLFLRNRVRQILFTVTVIPSYPIEFLCELVMSESVASHSLMIFQKI